MRLAACFFANLLFSTSPACCLHAGERKPAALIEKITGTGCWRQADDNKPQRLDPDRDLIRILYEGESIRCERGQVKLELASGASVDLKESSKWYKVRFMPTASASDLENSRLHQRALAAFADSAATPRGNSPFVSPVEGTSVEPGEFVIRWNESVLKGPLSLRITAGTRTIWAQDDVPISPRQLLSIPARKALQSYRDHPGDEELTIELTAPGGSPERSHFTLLLKAEEAALEHDIAFWDRCSFVVLCHLGRAAAFGNVRMFWEVAMEYNAALLDAPKSHDLVVAAIEANRRTNNLAMVEELTAALAGH